MVRFKLQRQHHIWEGKGEKGDIKVEVEGGYVLTPSGALVLPVMRRSQASLHSLMISSAYFLFLHSPLNANEFSCFPSGIYY